MFDKIKNLWKNHRYELFILLCIILILLLALSRIGKKGSWSSKYIYVEPKKKKKSSESSNFTSDSFKKPSKDSSGEIECRKVLSDIFKRPFNKDRPDFLRNTVTGGNFNLELDCFESDLRLACEYDGRQHYEYVPFFHKNKEAFYNQKYRDYMKKNLCKENGVNLIVVPYSIPIPKIKNYIIKELKRMDYLK